MHINLSRQFIQIALSLKFTVIRIRPTGTGRETSTSQDQNGSDLYEFVKKCCLHFKSR